MEQGLIHLYSGDGKGKTSAAIGVAIRAHGNKERVLFSQFMKDGKSGETAVLQGLEGVQYICAEDIPQGFYSKMNTEDQEKFAEKMRSLFSKIKEIAKEMSEKDGGVIILDEITYAYNWKIIDQNELLVFLKEKPENLEVILTGRNPSEEIIAISDYFSEISLKKHPFQKNIPARKGIEY